MKITSDKLVDYQIRMVRDNPEFPVRVEDYDKLNEFVISVKGLEQLAALKRLTLMGNATLEDKTILERLLHTYATTNPSKENLREWKKYVDGYMKDLLQTCYNPDLIEEGLVIRNEKYDPKYRKYWHVWTQTIVPLIYKLQREENGV